MERFFILDKYNTWYDWDLIVTAKDVTPPEPKTTLIEIDGRDGTLDASESLTGYITYKDRTISASFWTDKGTRNDRERLLQSIISALHGKKIHIIEPDDPDHYFIGRVRITKKSNILPYATFDLEATCEPYRYSLEDIVRTVDVTNNAPVKAVINNNGVKNICPEITVTGSVTLLFDGGDIDLTSGYHKVAEIKLKQGVNVIEVRGNGSVTFTYKEATL